MSLIFKQIWGRRILTAPNQPRPRIGRAAEHRFFLWMTVAISATVLIGFSRSFYLRPLFPNFPAPHEPFFLVHGIVLTLWFALLFVQAELVTAGRVKMHRVLGAWGAVLAGAVLVLGVVGTLMGAKRPNGFLDVPIPAPQFMIVPLVDILNFGALVAVAIVRRRDTQAHKRLILLASISMLDAAFARWPGVHNTGQIVYFLFNDLFLIPMIIWDWRVLGRIHSATLWGGGWFLLSEPLRLWISGTSAWLAAARWLISVA
jgi:hypothetical protein